MTQSSALKTRFLGLQNYPKVWAEMQAFTNKRDANCPDELWLVQHPSVFTQGQAGKPEHLLNPGKIPVVQTDRGGQVTYHGPGQLVAYPLLDLRRLGVGVRDLVTKIELSVVHYLASWGVESSSKADAPGVYVGGKKIASLGLRVRRGCSFHGVSLNVDMNLEPFLRINPCGYGELQMTQLRDCIAEQELDLDSIEQAFADQLSRELGFSGIEIAHSN